MLKKFGLMACCAGLTACGPLNVSDEFSYTASADEFSGTQRNEAVSELLSDVDSNLKMTVTLRCEYTKGSEPDPFRNTMIDFLLSDSKDEGIDFTGLTVKFDESPPPLSSFMKQINTSEYSNEISSYYVKLAVVALPVRERWAAITGLSNSFWLTYETSEKLKAQALNAKKLLIRYTTDGGIVHTSSVSIDGDNYRRILTDCGWKVSGKNSAATPDPSGTPSGEVGVGAEPVVKTEDMYNMEGGERDLMRAAAADAAPAADAPEAIDAAAPPE